MTAVGWLIVALMIVSLVAIVSTVCLIRLTLYTHKLEEELKDETIRKNLGDREMFF